MLLQTVERICFDPLIIDKPQTMSSYPIAEPVNNSPKRSETFDHEKTCEPIHLAVKLQRHVLLPGSLRLDHVLLATPTRRAHRVPQKSRRRRRNANFSDRSTFPRPTTRLWLPLGFRITPVWHGTACQDREKQWSGQVRRNSRSFFHAVGARRMGEFLQVPVPRQLMNNATGSD